MFNTKNAIKHSTNRKVCSYVFEKYINTIDYRGIKTDKERYYDHLGMIDTLGSDTERTINSFHFSNEGGSIYCIYSCGFYMVYVNYDSPEVYIFKENPFPLNEGFFA